MQIKSARIKSYRSWVVDDSPVSDIAKQRLAKIQLFEKLKAEGCSTQTALEACKELGIPLFVLPPRSPEHNGNVERANGVTREEFYSQYTGIFEVESIRGALKKYQSMYNSYRPHQTLDYLTPFEYCKVRLQIEAA